jgi:hypothetical protein
MNPFDLFNRSEGEKQRKRNDLKNAVLQVGALGATGYAASKLLEGANLKDSISQIQNSSSPQGRELGVAGQKIREELNVLQETLSRRTSEKLRDSILQDSKLDSILTDASVDIGERRAMLAALFDSYSMEVEFFDEGVTERIKQAYESDSPLSKQDADTVKKFYNTQLVGSGQNQEALGRFNARYKRYLSVSDLLDKDMLQTNSSLKTKDISIKDIGKKNLGNNKSFVENSFKAIQNKFGSQNVTLVERDLGKLGNNIEARINFKGSKIPLYVPLNAARTAFNTPIFAGASSGATLYSGPMGMLDAVELKNAGFQKTSQGVVPGMKRFEQVIVEELLRGGDTIQGGNFNKYNINEFYSFMRSFGTDLPSTISAGLQNKGGMENIANTLLTSKSMEGSAIYIQNVEEAGMKPKQVLNFLLKNMGDTFGGPGSAQTVTTSIEDPFNRTNKLNYSQVQLLSNQTGRETLNPLGMFKSFGRDSVDRALQPQTAREQQLVGRYEYLHSGRNIASDTKIGRLNNINVFGKNKNLLGMDPKNNASMRGANLGMFMVIGEHASGLGLSEGSAYSGGKLNVETALTKTVSQQGVEKFKLMTLLEGIETNKTNQGFLKVGSDTTDLNKGYMNIDEFFSQYGKNGEAVLGFRDAGFSVIKRHKGLQEFEIGITGRSEMGGRKKVHLSGRSIKGLENMKLFSAGFKGTLEYASEADVTGRLKSIGFEDQFNIFKGVSDYKASVITDESMIKKSAQFLGMQMFGGYKLFGGDEAAFMASMKSKIGADDDYFKMIQDVSSGKAAKDLSSASVKSRQGAFLKAMIESVVENTSFQDPTTGVAKKISNQELGMILGGVQKLGTRFGLEQSEVDTLISKAGASVLSESQKGIAAGAMYASSGDVYSDLGRNLARIEPRFANYMYKSLRSNFDFTADEATQYVSSLIVRQEGAAERASGALGMKLSAFSLGNMRAEEVAENLDALTGGVKKLSESEITDLISKAGREREIGEQLSQNKSGNILETNKLGLSSKAQSELEKALGGKKSFFLAGEETYEGLKGHIIRSQGDDINIANEYLRYTNDLVGAISGLRDAGTDEDKIRSAIKGFETSRGLMGKTAANTIRNVLSGKVLGSGTYRGRGISIGTGGQGNIGGKLMDAKQNKLMRKIFDKTAGYAIVADTQAFMDGMTSFKEAARRDLLRTSGKTDVKKEVNDLMGKTLRNFFLGIYEQEPVGVVVDSQRNPLIGMGNIFANMEMFSSGENAEAFEHFRRGSKIEYYQPTEAMGKIFKQYREEALNKGKPYKDRVEEKRTELIEKLKQDPKKGADAIALEAMDDDALNKRITSKIKPELEAFSQKHSLTLESYDDFNRFLSVFLGEKGKAGSISDMDGKVFSSDNDFFNKQGRRNTYLNEQISIIRNQILKSDFNGKIVTDLNQAERLEFVAKLDENKLFKNIFKLQQNVLGGNIYGLDDINSIQDIIRRKDASGNVVQNVGPKTIHEELIDKMREEKNAFYKEKKTLQNKVNQEIGQELRAYKQSENKAADNAAQQRMKDEKILESKGSKVSKSYSNLKKLEESYIASGRAPKDFDAKPEGFRFQNFEDIFIAEQNVKKTPEEGRFNAILNKQLRNMLRDFTDKGAQGGGTISFFDVKVSNAKLIGKDGSVLGNYSGRADINRAGIGDFDGDIYQVFFRTDNKSVRAKGRVAAPEKMFGQALSMDILLGQLTKGMNKLGQRMGADDMDLITSAISEKEKERILKGVGGVDIEVKTLMMGLAQSASDAGDPDEYFKSMKGGMALLASMQEQLVIQAKKLPMASNTPEAFTKSLRTGFKEGNARALKQFLTENVLKDTELLNARQLRVKDLEFANIDVTSTGGKIYKKALESTVIDLDEMFESLDKAMAAVKSYGINKMPSTNRLMKSLTEGRVADLKMLSNLLSASVTMEGGVMGGKEMDAVSALNRIMQGVDSGTSAIRSTFAQRAGAAGIAAGLVASGAIGTMMSRGEINPEGVFSDMRVRENMSMRNLQQNMGREHGNVSPQMVGGPQDNFYERPILSGETSVVSNVSTRFYGEAASMGAGVSMARQFVSAGGQAAMHVNDTRMPISNSYITKSIRD